LDLEAVDAVYFPISPIQKAGPGRAGVRLKDGSFFSGEVQGGDEENLYLVHPAMGRIALLIDTLSQMVLAEPELPKVFQSYQVAKEDDILYKRRAGARGTDYIRGTLLRFSSKGVLFDCSLGELEFLYEDIEAISLARWESETLSTRLPVTVLFREDLGMLHGTVQDFGKEGLEINTSFAKGLRLKTASIDSLLFAGDHHVYLSDLEPADVEEVSYLGDSKYFLYPHQRDRSVTGAMLSCGGRPFAKGLGLHARTTLSYTLDGAYEAFESYLGISDEVLELPAKGSVQFEVKVDGKTVFKSPVVRGGEGPMRLPRLDLKGASRMAVTVDFADGFDSGDRALLGNPVLIRARKAVPD
jgi:hypothetical protein